MIRIALTKTIAGQNKQCSAAFRRSLHSGVPPMQQAGFGKILLLLTPVAAGAGVVTYAKHDEKFRKVLNQQIPGIESVLKVLLQEEGNALEDVTKALNKASKTVSDVSNTVTGFFAGSKVPEAPATPIVPKKEKPSTVIVSSPHTPVTKTTNDSSSLLAVPAPPLPILSAPVPVEKSTKPKVSSTVVAPLSTAATAVKPSAPVAISAPAVLPKNITELEKSVDIAAQTAVREYAKAVNVLQTYNEEIKKVVDTAVEKLDNTAWTSLKNRTSARDTAVTAAETAAQAARSTIDQLEKSIASITKDAAPEEVEKVRNNIKTVSSHLNAARDELYNAKDSAQLSEKYWKNVEASRNYFVDEVEALFPGVNLSEKKLNLSKEDLDLFILYAHSHVLAYQKELQKLNIEGETQLRRTLESVRGNDYTEAIQHQLEFHLEKERQQLNIDNQKKLFRMQAESEKQLRQQMKRQAEAHSDHLSDAISQKEAELKRLFNRELNEKLSSEQEAYKMKLAAMVGKLKGMDSALKARADADRQVHQAQSLWSACQALWASVRAGEPGVSWQHKLRPLASEVSAVSRAAEGDELVSVVLEGLPAEAKSRGVYPEDALRERFIKVEQLARRLALVPAEGARLPIYLLSYIQSVFILTPSNPISQEELNNELVDFTKFDTYDILNRAKYWMERGDLPQTLKYMNLLKGAPRNIAQDWLKEARLLLETQQAANTLMAHAATSGLSFL